MKRKVLEILVDENCNYSFETEFNELDSLDPREDASVTKFERTLDPMIKALFQEYFRNNNLLLSKVVKFLTIADICADAQPYDNIESLWSMMMHSHLPRYEKKYRRMKEAMGFKNKVIEPISWIAPEFKAFLGLDKS